MKCKIDIINQIQNHNMKFLNQIIYMKIADVLNFSRSSSGFANLKFESIVSEKCSGQNDMLEVLGVS